GPPLRRNLCLQGWCARVQGRGTGLTLADREEVMKMVFVGIDVSAARLELAIRADGKLIRKSVANDAAAHRQLIGELQKFAAVRVVMEATGVYGIDLALRLDEVSGIELMVANPRAVSAFAKSLLQRSKTDRADALAILQFAERMPFHPWPRPSTPAFALRAPTSRTHARNDMLR